MALKIEVLPKQICELLPNDIVYLIYSYCGNTQYDIVLRQLKNIIDSSVYVIRDQRRIYRNYEMNICKYILSKNNQKMYLNGIVREIYYNYDNNQIDIFDYLNNFINNDIANFINYDPTFTIINNHTITTSIIVEQLYSDIETDIDSDDEIPDLAELHY
jgi:hypothetical protein